MAFLRFPRQILASRGRTRRGNSVRHSVPTDVDEVLRRLVDLPVSTWSYDFDHTSVRHLGPMAQDFAAAFGLGDTDRKISTVDSAGVALAAIQALNKRIDRLERRIAELESDG
jgi:hypothetical protein